jgi:signal transduction histidine kinase/CheY-like chemotaxis protein
MVTLLKKTKAMLIRYAQTFLVLLAFALMAFSSYVFVSRTENQHLKRSAKNAILFTEANIKSDMQELETFLDLVADTIAQMIIDGENRESVNKYILFINNYVEDNKGKHLHSATGIFGVFDIFGGRMLLGYESWTPPSSYSQNVRPWYTGAVLSAGEISITEPYVNEYSHQNTITLSRRIFDQNRRALGIVCLNIELDRIASYVVSTQFVEGGYGFLLSENMMVIAHPDPTNIGLPFRDVKSTGISALIDDFVRYGGVSEVVTHNYRGVQSIVFVQRLQNGWYMGVVTPRASYLQSIRNLAIMLTALGAIFATLLIRMLLRIYATMLAETRKTEIAEESNKAKSDFLARVSHEIRTPMNAILGITEIQLQDEKHRPITKEAFERIYNSGDLLLGIINDILDLSKIEAGKLVLSPAQYDIASLIHDTAQLNILRYETKPIEFILDVNENLPLILIGDELRIKQILNNLLSNAYKYTEQGTVKLTVYAESAEPSEPADTPEQADTAEQADTPEQADTTKKTLVFIVSDTGQGMTAEQVQELGTEYSRFNLEANRKTEGTGLGMNITRNLVHLMNGTFSVESTPGAGSTFTVRLPEECANPSIVIGKEMANNLMKLNLDNAIKMRAFQISREYMPYGTVLVVDDVETNLYVARGLLSPYGLSVETVLSGFEAIDKIKAGSTYDIIFMDHMMPRMDGIEATKIIRDLGYSKPVVALTANALAGQAAIFMENGFDDFISKPIDTRQLNMVLNKMIRDKQPHEVIEAARKQKDRLFSDSGQREAIGPDLAKIFVRDAEKAIKVIEDIYPKINTADSLVIDLYTTAVHGMKSALANMGETELSGFALNLEKAGRGHNLAVITGKSPAFIDALRALIVKYKPAETGEATEISGEDAVYLREKLLEIKTACEAFDIAAARNALHDLKNKTWTHNINEILDEITVHLLHSAFKNAAAVAESAAAAENAGM